MLAEPASRVTSNHRKPWTYPLQSVRETFRMLQRVPSSLKDLHLSIWLFRYINFCRGTHLRQPFCSGFAQLLSITACLLKQWTVKSILWWKSYHTYCELSKWQMEIPHHRYQQKLNWHTDVINHRLTNLFSRYGVYQRRFSSTPC